MLHLTEHEKSPPLSLTITQQKALANDFNASFEPAENGRVIVTPQQRAGIISVEGLQIHVRPKFPIRRLLLMLAQTADPYRWHEADVQSIPDSSLHDAVAALFARACIRTFQRGVLRSYHREDQSLGYVRGRLRIQTYLRSAHPLPIPVTADIFDDDIVENQILRAALAYLRSLPGLAPSTRSAVLRALRSVQHVQRLRDPLRAVREVTFTRQNLYYKSILTLAELVLANGSLEHDIQAVSHSGFVIDMPQMVEQWARTQLRVAWNLSSNEMRDSWRSCLWLDTARRVELIPDLAVHSYGAWQFVGDVKYKALREDGARQSDVYQTLAYLTATGLPTGTLLYIGVDGVDENLHLPQHGHTIRVVSVDLNGEDPRRQLLEKTERIVRGEPRHPTLLAI